MAGVTGGIFSFWPTPASFAAPFFLFPQSNVKIIYHISAGPQAKLPPEAVLYSANHGQFLKLTAFDQPFYLLLNRENQTAFLVSPGIYSYFDLPLDGRLPTFLKEAETAPRQEIGQRTVAGLTCTLWRLTALPNKDQGQVCVTSDGILLQAEGNFQGSGETVIQAMSVTREVFPAGFFAPPADFLHLGTLPAGNMLF